MDTALNLRRQNSEAGHAIGTPPRPWDAFDAYLFDIDGTLIQCRDAVHYFAFCSALKLLSGRELNLDGVIAHGNTDIGILRDALVLAGVPDSQWRPNLANACRSMCREVAENRDRISSEALPGVRQVLAHLYARGAIIGVATGNLKQIGTIKLERAGILNQFHFAAFSDGLEYRSDVYRQAVAEVHRLGGPHVSVCAVGDTPADIGAARDHSLSVIAVATGIHRIAELSLAEPDLCVSSLEELTCRSAPHLRNSG